ITIMADKVWYVTGCSNGIGKALVQLLLTSGARVAGTSRNKQSLDDVFGVDNQNFLALEVDLTSEASIQQSITATTAKFGTIDVLVNNAGYGQVGAVEDLTDSDIQKNFEINFYAPLRVIRLVAPLMRAQHSGYIMNVSSMGALVYFPAMASYCATKSALNMATDALCQELKPFGVKVLTINPGAFKSDFLNSSKIQVANPENTVYKELMAGFDMAVQNPEAVLNGDTSKLANVFLKVVEYQGELPVHVYVGADAHAAINAKAQQITKDLEAWGHLTN
ncbi:hypothetical protein SAMD00019534_081920, partial [Acytostelium subglobosum LB1]|uniref:hypothetical protein n=1 Tax=Acytostelium subglobosum LB1 TaxID=1410327 RepID=UPI0006448858